jgi:hypothetical protein
VLLSHRLRPVRSVASGANLKSFLRGGTTAASEPFRGTQHYDIRVGSWLEGLLGSGFSAEELIEEEHTAKGTAAAEA